MAVSLTLVSLVLVAPLYVASVDVRVLHVNAIGNPRMLGMNKIADWSAAYHNQQQKLLPSGYRFELQHVWHHYPEHLDAGKSAAVVLKELLRGEEQSLEEWDDPDRFVAIIGLPYSGVATALCQLTPHFQVVSISCCAGAPKLSEKKIYPSFVRAIASSNNKVQGVLAVLEDLNYKRVLLVVDQELGMQIARKIMNTINTSIKVLAQVDLSPTKASAEERERSIGDALKTIREREARIILIAASGNATGLLICRAYREGIATPQTHLWIEVAHQIPLWWAPSRNPMLLDEGCGGDVATLRQAYRGMLQMVDPDPTDFDGVDDGNSTLISPLPIGHNVSWFLGEIGRFDGVEMKAHLDCAVALFDTFTALALAIRHGELEHRLLLATEQAASENGTADAKPFWPPTASTLNQLIVKTQTMGLNAPIVFDKEGDRESSVFVCQWNLSATTPVESAGSFSNVAKAQPPHYALKWQYDFSQLDFGTPDGQPPLDHPPLVHPPPSVNPTLMRNIALAALATIVLLGGVAAVFVRISLRRALQRAELERLKWRVQDFELSELHSDAPSTTSRLSMTSFAASLAEVDDDDGDGGADELRLRSMAVDGDEQQRRVVVLVELALTQAQRQTLRAQTPVKLTMLSELRALLQANHENVLRFAGIYIAPASQASHAKRHNAAHRRHSTSAPPPPYMADVQLVFDYPLKGSLEALLLQDRLQLDWEFRIALVRDVAQGLQFVQRLVGRHGRVSSRRSCFVDSRFVAKLADYGLPELARANPAGAEPYER